MNKKIKILTSVSGIALCGLCFIPFMSSCNAGKAQFINHRGLSSREFENTKEAFIAAGKQKHTFGIETDVYLTEYTIPSIPPTLVCAHDLNPFRVGPNPDVTIDPMARDAGYMEGGDYEPACVWDSGSHVHNTTGCDPYTGYWGFRDDYDYRDPVTHVSSHDPLLNSFKITDHTWDEIKDKKLWTGHTDWDPYEHNGQYEVTTNLYNHYGIEGDYTVPKFSEYLSICKQYKKEAVIELKDDGAFDPENPLVIDQGYVDKLIEELVQEVTESGWIDHCTIIGFDDVNYYAGGEKGPFYNKLIDLNNINGHRYQKLVDKFQKLCWEDKGVHVDPLCDAYRAAYLGMNVDVDYNFVTSDLVKFVHQKNLKINCWTVNEKVDMEAMKKLGVDQITTNMVF